MHDLCIGHHLRDHVRWLIVTRDRFKIVDGFIRNNPRSGVVRQPDCGCGMGCLRQSGLASGQSRWPRHAGFTRCRSRLLHRFKAAYNPFVSHAFFSALEASGSACARTGWGPRHLIARLDGAIAGIVPCYLKSHSQGEYVFDRGWADAYERAGGRYYPKLQASVPFTPATGPRLLIRDGVDRGAKSARRWRAGWSRCARLTEASSVHVTFAREAEWKFLAAHGFLQRTDQQFHWHNQGYRQFRRFSRHPQFAPPQGDQARAARGGRQRHHHPRAQRQRHHRGRLGRVLCLLHGDRLAQMGPAVPHPRRSSR